MSYNKHRIHVKKGNEACDLTPWTYKFIISFRDVWNETVQLHSEQFHKKHVQILALKPTSEISGPPTFVDYFLNKDLGNPVTLSNIPKH